MVRLLLALLPRHNLQMPPDADKQRVPFIPGLSVGDSAFSNLCQETQTFPILAPLESDAIQPS